MLEMVSHVFDERQKEVLQRLGFELPKSQSNANPNPAGDHPATPKVMTSKEEHPVAHGALNKFNSMGSRSQNHYECPPFDNVHICHDMGYPTESNMTSAVVQLPDHSF